VGAYFGKEPEVHANSGNKGTDGERAAGIAKIIVALTDGDPAEIIQLTPISTRYTFVLFHTLVIFVTSFPSLW
jgi:hypothetical protein